MKCGICTSPTGRYLYTDDLRFLDRVGRNAPQAREEFQAIVTPLKSAHWESMLASHPDRDYTDYLLSGIKGGFRIGVNRGVHLASARKNMLSAQEHPQVVTDYLQKEMDRGVLLGPFEQSSFPEVIVSRFGVIPKGGQPGRWRLIVDLSHPEGRSINDGISQESCSLKYTKVENVVEKLLELGPGALMAKMDVQSAYRVVPVHPDDRHLLGMKWNNQIFVEAALPFGLRSAPKIFNALADAVEWMAKQRGVCDVWHYLDDFIVCGPPSSPECECSLQLMIDLCSYLGVPLAKEKREGPTTCLTFLGIEIDTIAGEVRLPRPKLHQLCVLLEEWSTQKRCTKRELLSIAGKLQHASTVVQAGRTFVRRLFDASTRVAKPEHHIKLNGCMRSDLSWWQEFMTSWNGISLMKFAGKLVPDTIVTSDASGWGCGGYWEQYWFQLAWSSTKIQQTVNIATKEMIPIVLACAMWGRQWQGLVVQFRCDNQAVVAVLRSRTSKDSSLMHSLRCLAFLEAHFAFMITAIHIPGVENSLADDLSRDRLIQFMQTTHSSKIGWGVPQCLIDLVCNTKPDWTSKAWRTLFRQTLSQDWQAPQEVPTKQA